MTPQEAREQQKHFRQLCKCVIAHLALMDVEMLKPSTPERGKRIATLCGGLEVANDIALRFGLGLERKGVKLRKIARAKSSSPAAKCIAKKK